ncbi:MAG TPA: site-specific integrase [Candidatus Eisenbacteria bacterium]|nr:site-specific integrase [Candidatus Eisenbacteria bacterium]
MLSDDYVVNGYRSLDRAERSVAHLREVFGRDRAVDITPDRVSAYIRARLDVAKPATIRLELAALGRMFTLAVRAGRVSHRPSFPSIDVRNVRTGFFEEGQLRAVIAQLPEHLRPVIEFAYLTGWRKGEVLGLQWRQVDFAAGTVRLEPGTTKNDEGRTFPFAALPALEALLRAQRARTRALEHAGGLVIPWVFHRAGKPILSFHAAWTEACRRAQVPGRLVHDLRRTAVRNLERAGVSRSVAMKLTGHKTESVYRRYAIVSEADLSDGVRKLAALHSR